MYTLEKITPMDSITNKDRRERDQDPAAVSEAANKGKAAYEVEL